MRDANSVIVIASSNKGKIKELNSLLPDKFILKAQSEFAIPQIEEIGKTFIENAILKARNASLFAKLPAIADDSGLEVDALSGKPGVYSARYAGPEATDQDNVDKLLDELKQVPYGQRTARFHCVVAFLRHADDPRPLICEGTWLGYIQTEPRGSNGFGYDPVFYVPTHKCTAAELDTKVKNQLSHRGQALAKLVEKLGSYPSLNQHDM